MFKIKCRFSNDYVAGVGADPVDGVVRVFWTDDDDLPEGLTKALCFETAKDAFRFRRAIWNDADFARDSFKVVKCA